MLLFGLGEPTKIVMILMIVLFQIVISIRDYIKQLDPSLYYPMKTLTSKDRQIIYYILIRATLPKLFSLIYYICIKYSR